MKNFVYYSPEEKENIEEVLKERKRKINRQQIIFGLILGVILFTLALYLFRNIYYTEYDGYVHVDVNQVRTPVNMFLDSVFVEEGDVVMPGDTLYSYYMLDMFVEQSNLNNEPGVVVMDRNMQIRYVTSLQNMNVLRVRIEELKRQIAIENHNISFGLSDNAHKLDLERALKEAEAQLKALGQEAWMLRQMKDITSKGVNRSGYNPEEPTSMQVYNDYLSFSSRDAMVYRLSIDSSIVIKVSAPNRMVFFEKETILSTQHLNLDANNLQILAYIPIDKMDRITNNSTATITVNRDVSFKAHVSVLGTRTEAIPEHLRSYFMRKNTAIIANLDIDRGQVVPFWSVAAGVPVKVRVRSFDSWGDYKVGDYLWFITGKGFYQNSLDVFIKRQELRKAGHERTTPEELERLVPGSDNPYILKTPLTIRTDSLKKAQPSPLEKEVAPTETKDSSDVKIHNNQQNNE